MKKQNHLLLLPLLLIGVWPGARTAQAATADAVGAWGRNSEGQTTAPLAAQSGVTAIAAGGRHTVALKNDGTVIVWGDNYAGQTNVPVGLSGVIAIAAGEAHTVALKSDGTLVAWRGNGSGQVTGTPTTDYPYSVIANPVMLGGQVLSGVAAIAAGAAHTVALKNDGSVMSWGENTSGQVTGTPTTDSPSSAIANPVMLRGQVLSGVAAIAAGGAHTVALKSDGTLVAWGENTSGQVTGTPTTDSPSSAIANPVMLGGQVLSGVAAIAAGAAHTVALMNDGSVVAWGFNGEGQTNVPVAAQSGVTAIAAGGLNIDGDVGHTVALKNDGSVIAWGGNLHGQTNVPLGAQSGVTAVAAGGAHTVVLVIPTVPTVTTPPASQAVAMWQSASFTVTAAGFPLSYQWRKDGVDLPRATDYRLTLATVNQAGQYTVVVKNILASVTSTPPAVLTVTPASPGSVVAWGGLLTPEQSVEAYGDNPGETAVPVAAQSGVTAIAAGGFSYIDGDVGHSVALKNDGSVLAWGNNWFGQTDVPLAAQSRVTAVAAGANYTVALKNNGTVVAWGGNHSGQVTGTPTIDSATASPVTLGGQTLSGVTAIAVGSTYNDGVSDASHTMALKHDGTVVAWGANLFGEVTGTPTTGDPPPYFPIADPVVLRGQVLREVKAIAAGHGHTVVLKNDGTMVAWGNNQRGQVTGTPTTDYPYSAIANPVALGGQVLSGLRAVAAGNGYTVALKNDGTVVAWGFNYYGAVTGTPTTNYPYTAIASPLTLGGQVLSGARGIAAQYDHTMALKNDGTMVAWGNNQGGQVTGTPTTDYPSSAIANPVALGGQVLTGVTAIAVGLSHSVALVGSAPLLPSLNAKPNGNELILSWPTNAVGFTLQSTLSLTPPVTWIDSTKSPAVIGAQFTITNPILGNAQFYRLR